MKPISVIACSLLLLAALCTACSKNSRTSQSTSLNSPDTVTIGHSMKGWEMYSWEQDGEWWFSLLAGTNAVKNYPGVISNPLAVKGTGPLKLLLDKFPEGEIITMIGQKWLKNAWGGGYNNLELPPPYITEEIATYCKSKNLVLQIAE